MRYTASAQTRVTVSVSEKEQRSISKGRNSAVEMSGGLGNIPSSDELRVELQRRRRPQEFEGLSRRPAVRRSSGEAFPRLRRLVVRERWTVKHPVHPFPEGGHRGFLLAVALGERHAGCVGRGGGASGRQHAGRVLGLQGALQRGGRLSDGPDFGLGFCALKARAAIEGGVLLADGRGCGTLRRQSLFFAERLRGRALARPAVRGVKPRPWFAVGAVRLEQVKVLQVALQVGALLVCKDGYIMTTLRRRCLNARSSQLRCPLPNVSSWFRYTTNAKQGFSGTWRYIEAATEAQKTAEDTEDDS